MKFRGKFLARRNNDPETKLIRRFIAIIGIFGFIDLLLIITLILILQPVPNNIATGSILGQPAVNPALNASPVPANRPPITDLPAAATGSVPGSAAATSSNSSPVSTPMVAKPHPTPPPTTKITPSSQEGYGIAAGGGLENLNQADLDLYFDHLRELGVSWVRWDIDWKVIQPDNADEFRWTGVDRVAATSRRYGINSLGILTYAPKWASDSGCGFDWNCAPADPQAFGRFAGRAALHFKDTISYWEIWNEPNYHSFWRPQPDVKTYTALLKTSYPEIKKANPRAVVICGGLANTTDNKNGNIAPLTFIKTLYDLGANEFFDAIALHPYSFPFTPGYFVPWNSWQQIAKIRELMVNNKEAAKKIWITEYGAPTGGPGQAYDVNYLYNFNYGSDYMKEDGQRSLMEDATNFYQKNKSWLGPFFWYTLRDNSDKSDTVENFFGLLRYDGSKKPAYDLYQTLILKNTK